METNASAPESLHLDKNRSLLGAVDVLGHLVIVALRVIARRHLCEESRQEKLHPDHHACQRHVKCRDLGDVARRVSLQMEMSFPTAIQENPAKLARNITMPSAPKKCMGLRENRDMKPMVIKSKTR